MGRYSKSYSNYILAKRHQDIKSGVLWSRDWVSIGNVHRLEPGKKPYYSDSGFIFTDNALPFFKKKHDYGKWVAHFVYDDVKDASSDVNEVKVNRESNDLRSYVYYGSCEDLIRCSIENIIRYFPGRIEPTISTLVIQDSDGSWIDTNKFIFENQFGLDMHTQTTSVTDFDNELHYLTATWQQYNIVRLDSNGNRASVSPIIEYTVIDAEGEVLESSRYHDEGYNYIRYKNTIFEWSDDEQKFVPLEQPLPCTNFFVRCSKYIIYNNEPFVWSETDGQYIPINALEICNDNYLKIYTIKIKTADDPANYIIVDAYKVNGEMVYCSLQNNFIIEPNENSINNYFYGLDGFEKKLLTRTSKPFYRNSFKTPYQLSNGAYTFVENVFTWPSRDYCIDIESMEYETFVNSLMDMGVLYDEVYSDCIWRCMTHESIKNFDWSYRRDYSENDTQDNIDGGERMMEVLRFYGRIYDDAKRYVDGIRLVNNITYNGYDNCPDAEISDKNEIEGWDVVSTIWEPYYYVLTDSVPQDVTVIPYPNVPTDVNSESPEWISVGCEDGAVYYHREYNNPIDESLTEEFLNDENFVIGNCNPWIEHNHNTIYLERCEIPAGTEYVEMDEVPLYASLDDPEWILVNGTYYERTYVAYIEVYNDPMSNDHGYWSTENTYTSVPSTINRMSPRAIRVLNRNQFTYYVLTEHAFDSSNYMHNRWYASRNPNAVTPFTSDIDFQRVLHISTNRIFKTKGTRNSVEMVMALFGLGYGDDYSITEYYDYTTPFKSDDTFYFYDELMEEPSGVIWDATNTFASFDDAIQILGPNAPTYIKVVSNSVNFYYELNTDYSYENIVLELYRHKDTERIYDDIYTGVPINNFIIGNTNYLIPYYTKDRIYDGYLYFQQKGGWGKKSNTAFQYDYSETIPYLHLIPNVETLLSIAPNQVSQNDVYYVFDTSDYIEFDEDVPFNLSHFFKVYDEYNPQRFSSWKNIPMEGNIVYDVNYNDGYVTHEDYLHAKYLNDILPTIYYNNPHTGIGKYDLGKEYFEYMHAPYKYAFENYHFDDPRYVNIAKQFLFTINEIAVSNTNEKFVKWLDTITYAYNSGTLISVTNTFNSTQYFLNNKVIILKNEINNPLHKKFMKDVVLKYVFQVIPSTAILILENFEIDNTSQVLTYTITATPNDPNFGETTGSGDYVVTTMAYLRAIETEGHHFVRWELNGELVSREMDIQVMVCDDAEYIAVFEEDCLINAECDTRCEIFLSCDVAESCTTTFLCETDDQCDIDILCSDETDDGLDWFYIENRTANENMLNFENYSNDDKILNYSYDKQAWNELTIESSVTETLQIPPNGRIYLRSQSISFKDCYIKCLDWFNVGGNIMSLLYGSAFTGNETTFPTNVTYAFYGFFSNADKLVDAGSLILPATTLIEYCYTNMFQHCQSLDVAPALPATTLAPFCYREMFEYCVSLATAPALPATTLSEYCYYGMFSSCFRLSTPPALPATTLSDYCYANMFQYCRSLDFTPALPATTLAPFCYREMFGRCVGLTTAPTLPATTLSEYCYYAMFRGCSILSTAPALPATTLAEYCYANMFEECITLTTAPVLPATTLADWCYSFMFYNCASLSVSPVLPATTLAEGCYNGMFIRCASLTTAPTLPATTLSENCYSGMFAECSNLTTAPLLPAVTLTKGCYNNMFYLCTSLTTAPVLSATTLTEDCYRQMFGGCTSLTAAPELPATILAENCYRSMFQGCGSLNYIKCMATDITAQFCTNGWVNGVAANGTFIKDSSMSGWTTGNNGIPSGWTVQDGN